MFLPMTKEEVDKRGWSEVDIVFVTGDAYVDHPSFAMAVIGRVLEAASFKVAILSQPDWHSANDWKRYGRPNLFFAISAGNMDSMVNHYTANKKRRNNDAYSPGGKIGLRPDRATLVYSHRAREAYKDCPIIIGGIEASLRRFAHYDYWSDTVRKSILFDSKADLLVFGMGEMQILEIAKRLNCGESIKNIKDIYGTAYIEKYEKIKNYILLPSYEEVKNEKTAFLKAAKLIFSSSKDDGFIQKHGDRAIYSNPFVQPLNQNMIDWIYDLPYEYEPHPFYKEKIPAFETIKTSITSHRGCFGGCAFCAIFLHQGKTIQSRSENSIIKEVNKIIQKKYFKGIISDIGGPTANFYKMGCKNSENCRKSSCLYPSICKQLNTSHSNQLKLLRKIRSLKGIKKVLISSGIRTDVAVKEPEYIKEIAVYHTGGHLKVAPEHCSSKVLKAMRKQNIDSFNEFEKIFKEESKKANIEQYLLPYFMSSHPDCDIYAMIELAIFMKKRNYRVNQVQEFIPTPMTLSSAMYYTGYDPLTGQKLYIPRKTSERNIQKAFMHFFKKENFFKVKKALIKAGRTDLIGEHRSALISNKFY